MYEKLEICGKDSVMKVMVECHFAEIQKVLHVFFLRPIEIHMFFFLKLYILTGWIMTRIFECVSLVDIPVVFFGRHGDLWIYSA